MGTRGEEQPKISVDKIENWNRVAENCRQEALKLGEAQLEEAGLNAERNPLRQHLEAYIGQALLNAQPNLRVNGHSFGSFQSHDMETFDEALDRRIWSLADTRLQWHKRLSENRRTVPRENQEIVAQLLEQQRGVDDDEDVVLNATETEMNNDTQVLDTEEISESTRRSIAFAEELAQTIPMQQERGDSVKVVSAEIKAM